MADHAGNRFPNGRRRLRWNGFRSIMDMIDPADPRGRSVGELVAAKAYPPDKIARIRMVAARSSRYVRHDGVTGREIYELDEHHNTLSQRYRFWAGNLYTEDVDAVDAAKIMGHPIIGAEFAYDDVEIVVTRAAAPAPMTYGQWDIEARRRPDSVEMAALKRSMGR